MNGYEITDLCADDAAAVAELERGTFNDPWSEDSVRDVIVNASAYASSAEVSYLAAGAKAGGTPVGYVLARAVLGEAELFRIAVRKDWRRQGAARELMKAFDKWAARAGVKAAFLEVRSSNTAASELYRENGFSVIGRRRGYYHGPEEDALVMEKIYGI